MRLRCLCHDYFERGIYMITLEVEGRRPILGRLSGDTVLATPLGAEVTACWQKIPLFHPEITLLDHIVMPDHFHGLLFIRRRMARHLGEVVRGFKVGCTKAYRAMYGATPDMPTALFSPGYHDRILTSKGQLATLHRYIRDNPRRLAVRRAHPDYFTRINSICLAGQSFAAYGNPFLLNRPERLRIQCSRRITPDDLNREESRLLQAAEGGAVLVSPCISPGEKQIARTALDAGMPLIALVENGFAPRYKPPGKYFDACAAGRLLLLAPWPYHADRRAITRQQCLALNQMAADICAPETAALDCSALQPRV